MLPTNLDFSSETNPKHYTLTLNTGRTQNFTNNFIQMELKTKNHMLCAEILENFSKWQEQNTIRFFLLHYQQWDQNWPAFCCASVKTLIFSSKGITIFWAIEKLNTAESNYTFINKYRFKTAMDPKNVFLPR